MQNRFGIKDFVNLLLLVVIGFSVWLAMFQRDREWAQLQDVKRKVGELEIYLSRLESKLEAASTAAPLNLTSATPAPGTANQPLTAQVRDESWARPGVPIEWQEPWTFKSDPRALPGFKPGGQVTEIWETQFEKITPYAYKDVYGRRLVELVMDSLGAFDPDTLAMRGVLAEAWQDGKDELWLRVKINPKARFSDGSPVTAEDLRWTFHEVVMNPQLELEHHRAYLRDSIKEVKVISDLVAEFTFVQAGFLNRDNALGLFVLPKKFYSRFEPAEFNQSTGLLLGSGPFKLETLDPANQWTKTQPAVLVRNEQYWGAFRPPLDRVVFKGMDNSLARLTEYKNGNADIITPVALQYIAAEEDPEWVKSNHNLKWVNMRSLRAGLIWNCGLRNGKPTPFGDKRTRIAMTLLLDREKMVRDIWKGVGEVAKGFANPGTPAYDPDSKPWPYDPEAGRALLKEVGWEDRNGDKVLEDKDGNEFVFELTMFGSDEIVERRAAFIKDTYAAAGIRVNVKKMDWAVGDAVKAQRDFDALLQGWGANAPESDPKQIFHSDAIKNQGDNYGQWNCPEADRFIDAARRELDPVKRQKLWREFERVMHEEQPYTWIIVAPWLRFVKPGVENVKTYRRGLEHWEFFRAGPVAGSPG